jgi:hypothetical protein
MRRTIVIMFALSILYVAPPIPGNLVQPGKAEAASYTYPCATYTNHVYWGYQIFENSGGSVRGSRLSLIARGLASCSSPNSTHFDYPGLVTSVQTDTTHIVQVGYAYCGKTVSCASGWSPGTYAFVYTPSDTGSGAVSKAAWGPSSVGFGHGYIFTIQQYSNPSRWYLSIWDTYLGQAWGTFVTRTWTNGTKSWSGVELKNKGSRFGVTDAAVNGGTGLNMTHFYIDTSGMHEWTLPTCARAASGDSVPTWFHCDATGTFFQVWGTSH